MINNEISYSHKLHTLCSIFKRYLQMESVLNTKVFITFRTQHFMKVSFLAFFFRTSEYLVVIFKVNFFWFWRQFAVARMAMIIEMLSTKHFAAFALER